jgi:hypothetical protein
MSMLPEIFMQSSARASATRSEGKGSVVVLIPGYKGREILARRIFLEDPQLCAASPAS